MESRHLLILEDGKGRREIPLGDDVYTLGRAPTCNILVFSMFVRRCDAVLRRQMRDDGTVYYQIHDGNLKGKRSIHGLLVNGRKVEIHDLENEDEILLNPEVVIKYYKIDVPPQPDIDCSFDTTFITPDMMTGEENE